jgi:hypothetical protein
MRPRTQKKSETRKGLPARSPFIFHATDPTGQLGKPLGVNGLGALLAIGHFEFDHLAFLQGLETQALDLGIVDEDILAFILRDVSISLVFTEPFYRANNHCEQLLFSEAILSITLFRETPGFYFGEEPLKIPEYCSESATIPQIMGVSVSSESKQSIEVRNSLSRRFLKIIKNHRMVCTEGNLFIASKDGVIRVFNNHSIIHV